MKHPRYTPYTLIQAVARITRRTSIRKQEGLMLAIVRMVRRAKLLPRTKRKDYKGKWECVLLEVVRRKHGLGRGRRRIG